MDIRTSGPSYDPARTGNKTLESVRGNIPETSDETVESIEEMLESIARDAGFPMAVEWGIASTGTVYVLQCSPRQRPEREEVVTARIRDVDTVPRAAYNPEVAPIFHLTGVDCPLSPLLLVRKPTDWNTNITPTEYFQTENIEAYSTRVLYPPTPVDLRYALLPVMERQSVPSEGVRAEPDYANLHEYFREIDEYVGNRWWGVDILVKGVMTRRYTFLIKELDDGHYVETSKGVCATKSDIPVSRYVLVDGEVRYENERCTSQVVQPRNGALVQHRVEDSATIPIPPDRATESSGRDRQTDTFGRIERVRCG